MNDDEKRKYEALVEALQQAIEVAECYEEQEKWSRRWRELLTAIGEKQPPILGDPSITEH